MVVSIIIGAVLAYLLIMFLMHELFRKFFHMLFFVGTVVFILAMVYFILKGI